MTRYFDWGDDPEAPDLLECELVDAGDDNREPAVIAARGSLPPDVDRAAIEAELRAGARAERLAGYVAEFPMHDPGSEPTAEDVAERRYLLVEENVHGAEPPYWLSVHASPADAGEYHVMQEYAEDWMIAELVDLDTGRTFDHAEAVTFTPRDESAD